MRPGWLALGVLAAALLLTGCPHEADDARAVTFLIVLEYVDRPVRDYEPQTLTVGPADVAALGVEQPVIRDDFSSFVVRTTTEVEGDLPFRYCLEESIVIVDSATEDEVHVIPPGTCLVERRSLRIQMPEGSG